MLGGIGIALGVDTVGTKGKQVRISQKGSALLNLLYEMSVVLTCENFRKKLSKSPNLPLRALLLRLVSKLVKKNEIYIYE